MKKIIFLLALMSHQINVYADNDIAWKEPKVGLSAVSPLFCDKVQKLNLEFENEVYAMINENLTKVEPSFQLWEHKIETNKTYQVILHESSISCGTAGCSAYFIDVDNCAILDLPNIHPFTKMIFLENHILTEHNHTIRIPLTKTNMN